MKEFNIVITETLQKVEPIMASSQQEAIDIARSLYDCGEIVLDYQDWVTTDFNLDTTQQQKKL
jgi:hypothetical protein